MPGVQLVLADEQERQAQVRNWKRLLQIAAELECRPGQLRAVRRPERSAALRARLLPSMEELMPDFERLRHRAESRGPPVRLRRDQRRRRADHPRAEQAVGQLRLLRAARLPPLRRRRRPGPDDALRRRQAAHLHIADCYNHRANVGNRYIINPPGVDARIHQHNEIGNGDVDWDEFFATLRDVTSTASPPSACSAGRRTPTTSTAGCSTGSPANWPHGTRAPHGRVPSPAAR